MNMLKAALIVVGTFHVTSCTLGGLGAFDYHVCIGSKGYCNKDQK